MISQVNLNIALNKHLKTLAGSTPIVTDGRPYEPNNNTYIRAMVMNGDTEITLSPNDTERQRGIYQINIYTPLSAVATAPNGNATLTDTIKAGWTKGLTANVANGGQKVIINQVNVSPVMQNDTHQFRVLSVYFDVIA